MRVTITITTDPTARTSTTVSQCRDTLAGNPQFDAWEAHRLIIEMARDVAGLLGDVDHRPTNR